MVNKNIDELELILIELLLGKSPKIVLSSNIDTGVQVKKFTQYMFEKKRILEGMRQNFILTSKFTSSYSIEYKSHLIEEIRDIKLKIII